MITNGPDPAVYQRRQEEQRLRRAYRAAATRMYWPHGVHVPEHAHVQAGEGGAFVEVQVWVPIQEAERKVWWLRVVEP